MKRIEPPHSHNWDDLIHTPIRPLKPGRVPRSNIPDSLIRWDDTPVVYFLFRRAEIIYIGSTTHLYNRLLYHRGGQRGTRKDFDRVGIVVTTTDTLLQTERDYIVTYRPRLNKYINTTTSFILDMTRLRSIETPSGETVIMPRYTVVDTTDEPLESSNDLEDLQRRYGHHKPLPVVTPEPKPRKP